ncbi:MAG: DUF1697 domain-containing protein [Anaerolineales bacterium]
MAQTQYLALLRGINVGGNNIIKMVDLKACFESMGLTDVITYIQSGNVIFKSAEKDKAKLTKKTEAGLSSTFNYEARLVVISHKQLKQTVEDAPRGFGKDLDKFQCNVIFLREPLTPKEAMKNVSVKEGVDNAYVGKDVLYFSRLTSRASSSHLTKIIGLPVYQSMTIRNWNTTTKLLALMEKG